MNPKKVKVFLISLGCAKNRVDSEHMLGMLASRGHAIAPRIEEARVAVVNTCAFIREAVEEAVDTVLETVRLKQDGRLDRLLVTGCAVQRYGYKLAREIPEVDGWLGTGELARIAEILERPAMGAAPVFLSRPTYLADDTVPRIHSTPFYSGYLKIAEGCSHRCTYCIIPKLRGPFRSRSPESLLAEAQRMADRGVWEINLVAQDTTWYGRDLKEDTGLEALVAALVRVPGLRWIRLLYCHPARISDRLLGLMEDYEALCPYLDLPFQHVSRRLLLAMGREPGPESPMALIERVRSRRRAISLRTSLMVGFPGETDAEFRELLAFVRAAQFDHMGAFAFSAEEGTRAARCKGAPPPKTAAVRRRRLMALQSRIAAARNRRAVGSVLPVLVEGASPETELLLTGRTATMAPDVDGKVLINRGQGVVGEVMPVLIREAHVYDLVGEIVEVDGGAGNER